METPISLYQRHRVPPIIIQCAVWLHHRFTLSFRNVEDLLAVQVLPVSYEIVRIIDILIQEKRDTRAAVRLFRRLIEQQSVDTRRLVTDKLKSYPAARRQVIPGSNYVTERYEINRAEVSREPTRQREHLMRRFKSVEQTQRFHSAHGMVQN